MTATVSTAVPVWLQGIVAGGVILGAIAAAWHKVSRRLDEKIVAPLETITGKPSEGGRPAIVPLPEIVAAHGAVLQAIHEQVFPNGGSSLRDAIDKALTVAEDNGERVTKLAERVERIEAAGSCGTTSSHA